LVTVQVDTHGLEHRVYGPHWPSGLHRNEPYQLACDDVPGAGLRVLISNDGDVWVQCHEGGSEQDDENERPYRDAGIRVRTWSGGGRHLRTHQALLWLARAIQLDAADRGSRT
jgi:hypothetical protein